MAQSNKKSKKIKTQAKSTKKAVIKASKKAKGKKAAPPPKHKKKQVVKPHKPKASQARSAKKKVKATVKKKTQISKAKQASSKKVVAKSKTTKPKSAKKPTSKIPKEGQKPLKKVVATTQKKSQLKKTATPKVKDKLKNTKKELQASKPKATHKSSQKVIQKESGPLLKKNQKNISQTTEALAVSQPKIEPSSQKTEKETFYDAIEAAFHNEQVVLTNAEGKQFCHHKECDQVATTDIYCRHHYILLWGLIQRKKKILEGGQLEKFIHDITSRYPDKFLDMIRKNLSTERDFTTVLQELEITHASDHTSDYQDSHKDISLEDDHLPFSDERPET